MVDLGTITWMLPSNVAKRSWKGGPLKKILYKRQEHTLWM